MAMSDPIAEFREGHRRVRDGMSSNKLTKVFVNEEV